MPALDAFDDFDPARLKPPRTPVFPGMTSYQYNELSRILYHEPDVRVVVAHGKLEVMAGAGRVVIPTDPPTGRRGLTLRAGRRLRPDEVVR